MASFKCDATVQEVESMDMFELSEILEENEIQFENLETEEEIRELVLKHLNSQKSTPADDQQPGEPCKVTDSKPTSRRSAPELMNHIISNDLVKKSELTKIYGELQRFFENKENKIDRELKQELETEFQNFEETLKKHPKELSEDECPIVVAGETSAGKSSILNLLLGSDILPHSLLCSTSTICILHNSDEKRVTVTKSSSREPLDNINQTTDANALKALIQEYVSVDQNRAENPYEYVDIYWPVPMLKKHVIIVDTPGIGEDPKMTERLLKYLPKAVGFIYVINSANAGGVQSDRLLKIFEFLSKEEQKGRSTFDHRCAIFICNKWDQVSEGEADKVWKDTCAKLEASWPMFDAEKQLFKLSAKEVSRRLSDGLPVTEKYERFLQAIEKIIPFSLEAKIMRHVIWLKKFFKRLMYLIVARINASKQTAEEKSRRKCEVEERIKILQDNLSKVKAEVTAEAEKRCQDLAEMLHEHLMDPETRVKMIKWPAKDQLPDGSDMEVIQYKGKQLIKGLIEREVARWCKRRSNVQFTSELADIFKDKCKLLQEQCNAIDQAILGAGNPFDTLPDVEEQDDGSKKRTEPLFTRQEKIAMAIFSPLFLPLVVAAGIVALPVGIGVAIKDAVLDKKRVSKYRENKIEYLDNLVDEVLNRYTKEAILKWLNSTYIANFSLLLEYVCEDEIPKQIEVDTQLITHIINDIRESELIRKVYLPLERETKIIHGNFLFVLTEYFDQNKIQNEYVKKGEQLAAGCFSTVYECDVFFDGTWTKAALKDMKFPLEDEHIYTQLTEVKHLCKFSHENIVKLYGVSFRNGMKKRYLQLIMELCDDTLESRVIASRDDHNIRPCSRYKLDSDDVVIPFRFYCKIALDICSGLEYIHNLGFMHRDLKLSNILLKNEVAKIADVGFAKSVTLLTGSVIGTPTYMAPEVLDGRLYTKAADVYSLAVILWEMWYGKRAYSGPEYNDVQQYHSLASHVKSGLRPAFEKKHKPWTELEFLIKKSWKKDPCDRCSVAEIQKTITELKESKCTVQKNAKASINHV